MNRFIALIYAVIEGTVLYPIVAIIGSAAILSLGEKDYRVYLALPFIVITGYPYAIKKSYEKLQEDDKK